MQCRRVNQNTRHRFALVGSSRVDSFPEACCTESAFDGELVCGERMSEKVVWQMLKTYVAGAGLPDIAPHDLRRTTAKLCRAAGGELEQIQLLLGHSSVQTTERYLGTKQDLAHAPNDAIKLTLAG